MRRQRHAAYGGRAGAHRTARRTSCSGRGANGLVQPLELLQGLTRELQGTKSHTLRKTAGEVCIYGNEKKKKKQKK